MQVGPLSDWLGFAASAVRSNFFGLGCPVYCSQPSVGTVLSAFLLGFASCAFLGIYLLWTFAGFGIFPSGGHPTHQPPRAPRGHQADLRWLRLSSYLDAAGHTRGRRDH